MRGARSLAFRVKGYGPYELHVDGRKVVAFGELPDFVFYPAPVYVDVDDGEHVIALHVRNPDWRRRIFEGIPAGARVEVTTAERARTIGHRSALLLHAINGALVGGALALGLMHLILLWFNRRQRHHLYFGIFSLSFAFAHAQSILMIGVTGSSKLGTVLTLLKIGSTVFGCSAVLTLHTLLLEPTR